MNELSSAVMNALAALAVTTVGTCLFLDLKWLVNSKRQMETVIHELEGLKKHVSILFRLQGPQLMSLKATLEAQRDGECNGNVEEALEAMEEAKRIHDNHLLEMLSHAGDGEKSG